MTKRISNLRMCGQTIKSIDTCITEDAGWKRKRFEVVLILLQGRVVKCQSALCSARKQSKAR